MWHRFRPSAAGDAPINALQSLIMVELVKCGGKATLQELAHAIRESVGARLEADDDELSAAVVLLVEAGWLSTVERAIEVLPEGLQLVEQYERRFTGLMEVFRTQLSLDLKRDYGIADDAAPKFTQVVLDALIDLFELRGREIMRMVWDDTPIGPRGVTDLLQTLWLRANTLEETALRASLVGFVLKILMTPNDIYENVLNYLARSFFCIQAMRVHPAVTHHVSQVVSDRCLLIDENILIPLTAKFEDRHEFISQSIRTAQTAGLKLCTTLRFVDIVREHANWASNLVQANGTQSGEVIAAAVGQSGYSPNAFLKGFINQDPDDCSRDFFSYLEDCFGGSYNRDAFDAYIEDHLGITILESDQLAAFVRQNSDLRDEAIVMMMEINRTRPEENRKSERRIHSEVEALLLTARWSDFDSTALGLGTAQCTFVTSGSSVPHLARNLDVISGPMMVASAEMLWELLERLDSPSSSTPSFRSMMTASYFRLADEFIKPENCRRFFQPLIASAKKEFDEARVFFEEALGSELGDDYLDDFEEVMWPSVDSLVTRAFRVGSAA